jgi:tetratricopeptide (TPR) repeat protein
MLAAIRFFEQAIEKDAKYALAWAGLADAHSLLIEFADYVREESYPKAKLAAENALKYDDQLAEAHTSIASLKMLFEWDWTTAEKEFKHAIRLNPNYATAHHWYGEWLLFMGESEKALSEVTIASEIDPLSPAILKDRGMALYYTRHYDEAIESGKKTLELDPKFASAHRLLSLAYQGKRMFAEALEENVRWGEAGWDKAEVMVAAAQLHAAAGNEQESRRLLQTVLQGQSLSGNLHRGIALVYASLGEKELALDWLEKTYHRQAESISSIKVDPKFDILRSEPRLIELMKKVGIADEHGK